METLRVLAVVFSLPWLFILQTGCSKDDEETAPPATSTAYLGTLASGTESGNLTLSIAAAKTAGTNVAATGTLRLQLPSPATIALTGTFVNDTLRVNGGGYRLTGIHDGLRLRGTFVGPSGNGGFTTQVLGNNAGATYCGTYTSQVAGQENGTFNLVVISVSVAGIAISVTGQNSTQFTGTVVGNIVNMPGLGTGAINGNTISGTFDTGSNRGVWSATVCQ